jgi:hypothetical protein
LVGEVVEELTVQLTVLDTKLEVLATAKGSEKLSTELVTPVTLKPEAVALWTF